MGKFQLTNASACLGAELGLKNRNSGVDDTHSDTRDDSPDNHLGASIRSGLNDCTDDHDRATSSNGLSTAIFLAEYRRCYTAKETAN